MPLPEPTVPLQSANKSVACSWSRVFKRQMERTTLLRSVYRSSHRISIYRIFLFLRFPPASKDQT